MTFDAGVDGTSANAWDALVESAPVGVLAGDELLVIAPHPDDETLGAGGLIAEFAQRGLPVTVVLVTDGAPDGDAEVIATRSSEVRESLAILAPGARLIELGIRDGTTRENLDEVRQRLGGILDTAAETVMIVAPWVGDGHRDHRVVGEAVVAASGRRRVWAYPIWMWHWGAPDDVPADWVALPIDAERKARALGAFSSQIDGPHHMLRESFLQHFHRSRELFLPQGGPSSGSLDAEYFQQLYQRRDDPWRYLTRWYERRKRAVTVASLPRERYGAALEVGCSIGVLTDDLAGRCDDLLAVDVSERAVALARERVGGRARVERVDVGAALPPGPFDLIVLSEVGYYLDDAGWDAMLRQAVGALAADGDLLLCHWRHPVTDYPQSGDEVHARAATLGLTRMLRHEEEDFVLETFSRDPRSVAAREGFL